MDDMAPVVGQPEPMPARQPRPPRVMLPVILLIATFLSTLATPDGLPYALAIMTTLLAHELGHYFQARWNHVPASLPYFIPMPFSPVGTMGAVIVMQPGMGNRRALFDIGITGPLAGLVPALFFSVVGLYWSHVEPVLPHAAALRLGEPLLFKFLAYLVFGPLPDGYDIYLHPVAFAGWVGMFITALNLFPIGQLDGGHVIYALLLRRAYPIAQFVLLGSMAAVVIGQYWGWSLMILLLMLMGPIHPPTADDSVPLGTGRTILGWLSLLFVFVGFTPVPFSMGM